MFLAKKKKFSKCFLKKMSPTIYSDASHSFVLGLYVESNTEHSWASISCRINIQSSVSVYVYCWDLVLLLS